MAKILVTGGAGFIGSNLCARYLKRGDKVALFDNLSRMGSRENLRWLESLGGGLEVVIGDVRVNVGQLRDALKDVDVVFHLAGQVAVTTSVLNPREDFEINALGTFNVLEAVRESGRKPVLFYSSTNKVYGSMEDLAVIELNGRYAYKDFPQGIGEDRILDFHSPYGCSKGCADQYVCDYARIYGLRTVVFRKSCIYGYRQFGIEDQGWVAWFAIAALLKRKINIFGNGKQVRDVLFIEDLLDAYDLALRNIGTTAGRVYNIGGGPNNQLSLFELVRFLEGEFGRKIELEFHNWRPGDQPVFCCDISKANKEFGWEPRTGYKEGVNKLAEWIKDNKALFNSSRTL